MTGERFKSVSEDPSAARQVQEVHESRIRQARYQQNVGLAGHYAEAASDALSTLLGVVERAREIALQFSSGLNEPAVYQIATREVAALAEEAVRLANAQVDDRYLFGGAVNAAPPVDPAGVYTGDNTPFAFELGDGVQVNVLVDGAPIFGSLPGQGNVVGVLRQLETALASGTPSPVSALFGSLNSAWDAISAGEGVANSTAERLAQERTVIDDGVVGLAARRELLAALPLTDAAVEYADREQALRGLYAAIGRTEGLSLLQFLR